MLEQKLVLQGKTTVLIIQLSQEVVESNPRQRVLQRHRLPGTQHFQKPARRSTRPVQIQELLGGVLPVNALDPPAQILTDVHGEHVIIQLVHLLQVLTVQHLELAPLRHLLGK